jgi:hypothetical protein
VAIIGEYQNNTKINTVLFDNFLIKLDLYLEGVISKDEMESSFTEDEWDELFAWKIVVITLIREHDGFIDKVLEDYEERVKEDQGFKENFAIALHLKKILDENPARLTTFEDMVVYLEEEWQDTIYGHF